MIYGVDVSHYQNTRTPGGLSWAQLKASGCEFAIVRATYGVAADPATVGHVQGARAAGLAVGLYHFFRSGQPVAEQAAAFLAQSQLAGMAPNDIAPAIDIENDGTNLVNPAWQAPACALSAALQEAFGEVSIYMTQHDFARMGKPLWVLDRPLWVAHYNAARTSPATPGDKPAAIWQHRVGPYAYNGPSGYYTPATIDQNIATELPRMTRVPEATA